MSGLKAMNMNMEIIEHALDRAAPMVWNDLLHKWVFQRRPTASIASSRMVVDMSDTIMLLEDDKSAMYDFIKELRERMPSADC